MNFASLKAIIVVSASAACFFAAPVRAGFVSGMPANPAFASVSVDAAQGAGKDKTQTQAGAENFISSMAKRALDFLGNGQQTQTQKTESFRRLLEDNYDMETIGRFTLGLY